MNSCLSGITLLSQNYRLFNPRSLGVASGDPLPNSIVIWTRLAPDPLNGGGMPQQNVSVEWQIAADENLRQIVSPHQPDEPAAGKPRHQGLQGVRRETGADPGLQVGDPDAWMPGHGPGAGQQVGDQRHAGHRL